ncbi:hypothetical protein [Acinetobacter indicus]|uniref:hypothetical protein n=1 Tax=Acinetobacter indicus TaxID=756892 RepID=UPI000CEBF0E1|nr:hypothetical protein [Acinetobacter indicus]
MFDTTQVPIQEPIYVNGHISQVWLMFFMRLSKIASFGDAVDLRDITLLAHQLPTQASQGQMQFDIDSIKGTQIPIQHESIRQTTPHPVMQIQIQPMHIQPLQAVFLCPDFLLPILDTQLQQQEKIQVINLPTSEVIHDSL